MGNISLHFSDSEFKCPCCGQVKINTSLLYLLEAIREHFQRPINITSGYRCPKHNAEIGGAGNSQHLHGTAADIVINGVSPSLVFDYANTINKSGGLGKYVGFTHVDVCTEPVYRRW